MAIIRLPSAEELASEVLAPEIARQVGENAFDDLGDGESIILFDESPAINLVELAEVILKYFKERTR